MVKHYPGKSNTQRPLKEQYALQLVDEVKPVRILGFFISS